MFSTISVRKWERGSWSWQEICMLVNWTTVGMFSELKLQKKYAAGTQYKALNVLERSKSWCNVLNLHEQLSRSFQRWTDFSAFRLNLKICSRSSHHRLNMELDPQRLFGLLCTAVLIGWDPATPPFPPHLGSYTRALLVNQDRRHLFVTYCLKLIIYCSTLWK